jgi:hypothetical protein
MSGELRVGSLGRVLLGSGKANLKQSRRAMPRSHDDYARSTASRGDPPQLKTDRRNLLLGGIALLAATAVEYFLPSPATAQTQSQPNILVIFGDDTGQTNISAYSFGLVGY